jgi:uncharacterized membrane protein (UPF0127 family)
MKKAFLILILMAHLTSCSISNTENPAKISTVKIGDQVFQAEIADTNELRQRGLMFRENLAKNSGMIFIFDHIGKHSFWMKNTLIPLDLIWISADKKVVDVQTLQPCTKDPCQSYIPKNDAKYVLEVGAGIFRGILGDTVEFDL